MALPDSLRRHPGVRTLTSTATSEDFEEVRRSPEVAEFDAALESFARSVSKGPIEPKRTHCIEPTPQARSASVDASTGLLVGLHIDNWHGLSLANRYKSGNRISVNLGPTPRWLTFVPKSLRECLPPDMQDDAIPHSSHTREVLLEHLDWEAVKIRIDPMCFYIADTEVIVHDGFPEPGYQVMKAILGRFHWQHVADALSVRGMQEHYVNALT